MLRSLILPAVVATGLAPAIVPLVTTAAAATECAQHIQAIERRMHSAGASEVTGQPASPASKSQASNPQGKAPPPVAPEQKATPAKMQQAEALLAKAKEQDKSGDKQGCEQTMQDVQANMGALP